MKILEIESRPAIIFEEIPDVLTAERAVHDALGPDHYLMSTAAAEARADRGGGDRRLTLPELKDAIDWDDTRKPLDYPLVGPEATLVIRSLSHRARQAADWHQANAAWMLESIGRTRTARFDRGVSAVRTWLRSKLTGPQTMPELYS